MATGRPSQLQRATYILHKLLFISTAASLLWSSSHSLGRNPPCAVILFDLIWFVAHRAGWWERLLSWPSRNKQHRIRHVGLSVLAHTMGINWSPNTTDKSIPSFPPVSSPANWTARLLSTRHLPPMVGGLELDWQKRRCRERESIRKPLAAGVKVWVVLWSAPSKKQSTESSNVHRGGAKLQENGSEQTHSNHLFPGFNRTIKMSLNCK